MKFISTAFFFLALLYAPVASRAQDTVVADIEGASLLWERPLPAVVTSGLLLAGSSTLFFEPAKNINLTVRDKVQAWRQERFDNAGVKIDNYLQYVPYVAVEGLNLLGVPSRHTGWALLYRTGSTAVTVFLVTQALKFAVGEQRPDSYATTSFPSGHTAFAFGGAELLRLEYGETSPLIPVVGFTVSAATGALRIYNNRHWLGDVLAGAAIGMICSDVTYWLNGKLEGILAPNTHRK